MPGEKRSVASLLGQPALLQIIEKSAGDKSDKAAEWSNVCNAIILFWFKNQPGPISTKKGKT